MKEQVNSATHTATELLAEPAVTAVLPSDETLEYTKAREYTYKFANTKVCHIPINQKTNPSYSPPHRTTTCSASAETTSTTTKSTAASSLPSAASNKFGSYSNVSLFSNYALIVRVWPGRRRCTGDTDGDVTRVRLGRNRYAAETDGDTTRRQGSALMSHIVLMTSIV